MLRAQPKGWLSSTFMLRENDEDVGMLKASRCKDRAELVVGDKLLLFYRERMFSGRFILESDAVEIACAVKPSIFKNRFELTLGSHTCEVRKPKTFSDRFEVTSGGRVLGDVTSEGWFTHRASINLPEEWPVPVRAFVFWLVLLMWRRSEAAAGA